jgi:tRNA pseudouridine55 synthase
MSLDKEYLADLTFGFGTDTLDPEGVVTAKGPVPSSEELQAVLPEFRGPISQVPPVYSAVHIEGRRASAAARNGEAVQLKAREVRIDHLEMLEYRPPVVSFRVCCSKGTYIRSLARDISTRLGTCAFVSSLRRIRIGGFLLQHAKPPDAFDTARDILSPIVFFRTIPSLGMLAVKNQWAVPVSKGVNLNSALFEEAPQRNGTFGVFASDQRLLAVIEISQAGMRYLATFPDDSVAKYPYRGRAALPRPMPEAT